MCGGGIRCCVLRSMVKAGWAILRALSTTSRWTDTLGGFKASARCQNYQG